MDAQKTMTKQERIASKIAALQQQLDEIKTKERKQVKADARKEVERVLKRSGLLALVRSGKVSAEQLEAEFRSLADRTRGTEPNPATQPQHEEEHPASSAPEEKKKGFWER